MLKNGEKIICSYCGEETKHYAKGFCRPCWARNNKYGNPAYSVRTKTADEKLAKKERLKHERENRYNPKSIRGKEFNELYKSGMSLEQIGGMYSLTRERVRQILNDKKSEANCASSQGGR